MWIVPFLLSFPCVDGNDEIGLPDHHDHLAARAPGEEGMHDAILCG